jgi:tRNA pseudouridine38-40 synthase
VTERTHYFALGIEYDGSLFHGWQRQAGSPSVQAALEDALGQIAAAPVRLTTAGRTDAGVHATGQVANFASAADRPLRAWLRGTNSLVADGVTVHWVQPVDASFNARFSALSRHYQYVIVERPTEPAVARRFVTWSRVALDVAAMHQAAQFLIGEQDFTSVRAAGCQSNSPFRCVFRAAVRRIGGIVVFDICANAFLLHMVRNIAGVLLQIGRHEQPPGWMPRLLAARDRKLAAPTAPANGLYLVNVAYPERFGFPQAAPPLLLRALGEV